MSVCISTISYKPLDSRRQEFRLLSVLPDEDEESPIHCILQYASLEEPPEYTALSSVWGDGTVREDIAVDDATVSVDIQERNAQILLVGKLYCSADSVVAYIGQRIPNFELAVKFTETFVDRKLGSKGFWKESYWWKLRLKSYVSKQARREWELSVLRAWNGHLEMCLSPYFSRMWTFQEYHLPPEKAICVCGDDFFDLHGYLRKARDLHTEVLKVRAEIYTRRGLKQDDVEEAYREEIDRLLNPGQQFKGEGETGRFQGQPLDVTMHRDITELSISQLIAFTSHRKCSNPLDRVYALYALAPVAQAVYPPDYNKSIEKVLKETTIFIVNYEKNAFISHMFRMRETGVQDTSLPSWVPDYGYYYRRVKDDYCVNLAVDLSLCSPNRKLDTQIRDDDTSILRWRARVVGPCRIAFRFGHSLAEVITQIDQVINHSEPESIWKSVYYYSSLPEKFIRTCLEHRDTHDMFSTNDILEAIQALSRSIAASNNDYQGVQGLYTGLLRQDLPNLYGKSVFTVERFGVVGFGIGVPWLQDGDLITISTGVNQPIALRRCVSTLPGSFSDRYHRMVGLARMEGIGENQKSRSRPFVDSLKNEPFFEFDIC